MNASNWNPDSLTETKDPLVSVIIPVFNRAEIIVGTIQDVLRQTYRNLEIVVIDDGSTDETPKRLLGLGKAIRTVTQENQGPAAARNRGILEARGEIIAFQDSDDHWHPSKIRRQVDLLQKLGPSVPCCFSNAVLRTSGTKQISSFQLGLLDPCNSEGIWLNPAEVVATRCLFFNQVVAARREALLRVGGFNPGLKYLEEWDLALKLSLLGPWAFIAEPLAYWNAGSIYSVSSRAATEVADLHACGIRVLSDALNRLSGDSAKIRKYLSRTLRVQQRLMQTARTGTPTRTGTCLATGGMWHAEHYHRSIRRKPEAFPFMHTMMVD